MEKVWKSRAKRMLAVVVAAVVLATLSILPASGTTPGGNEPELPELKTDSSALFIGANDFAETDAAGGKQYLSYVDDGKFRLRSLAGYEYLYFRVTNSSEAASHFEFTYYTGSNWGNGNDSTLTATKCEYLENDSWNSLGTVKHLYANWEGSHDMFEVPAGKNWIVRVSATDLGQEVRKPALQLRLLVNDGIQFGDIYAGMRETNLSDLPRTDSSALFIGADDFTVNVANGENKYYSTADAGKLRLRSLAGYEYLYFRLVNRSDSEAKFSFYNWTPGASEWVMYAGAEYEYRIKDQTEWTNATAHAEEWAWGKEMMVTVPGGFDGTFRIKISDFYRIDDPNNNRGTVNPSASLTGELKQAQLRITGDLLFGDVYAGKQDTKLSDLPPLNTDGSRLFLRMSEGTRIAAGETGNQFWYNAQVNNYAATDAHIVALTSLDNYEYLYFRLVNRSDSEAKFSFYNWASNWVMYTGTEYEYRSKEQTEWIKATAQAEKWAWDKEEMMVTVPKGFDGTFRIKITDFKKDNSTESLTGELNQAQLLMTGDLLFGDIYATPIPLRKTGDVNGDDSVDIIDLVKVKKHTAGVIKLTGTDFKAADLDENNQVDSSDLIRLRKILLGVH